MPPIPSPRPTVLDPTRARPEPWFVGGGTGLMIGVLSVCAVLLVVRGVSVWWMVREAARWWRDAPSGSEAPPPARALPPVRTIPPPDPRKANQPLRGNAAGAFPSDSYPAAAMRANEQGRVVARLRVDATGTPTACRVTASSQSDSLDRATCATALRGVRFDPARDGRGAATASDYTLKVTWRLPEPEPGFPGADIVTGPFRSAR